MFLASGELFVDDSRFMGVVKTQSKHILCLRMDLLSIILSKDTYFGEFNEEEHTEIMQWCKSRVESWTILWAMSRVGFASRLVWIVDDIWEIDFLPTLSRAQARSNFFFDSEEF